MKKIIALLLTATMACGAANAYNVQAGQIQASPHTIQADLASNMTALGLTAPKVSGYNDTSSTATLGGVITVYAQGTQNTTRTIAARLDTSASSALNYAQAYGALCGSMVRRVDASADVAAATAALKLENTTPSADGTDNLRTFFSNHTLFSYEVRTDNVRFTAVAYPEDASGIALMVNDSLLTLDVSPKIVDGRTLVPVRGIFEQLNAQVQWDQASQTATMTKGDTTVQVTIGSKTAYVNGTATQLDVPAQLSATTGNARTLVPVRFISESLGALVGWNADTQTVVIAAR